MLLAGSLVLVTFTASGQVIDPVGFCPPPGSVTGCTTATGPDGETIAIGASSFAMMKNGNGGTAINPWYLLVAVPENIGGAPTLSTSTFTTSPQTGVDLGAFTNTPTGDLYQFAATQSGISAISSGGSLNASNLFGTDEDDAFNQSLSGGAPPTFFEVYLFTYTPQIQNNTPYLFTVNGAPLTNGTFLAAAGGTNPFTTPFTVAGLVGGPNCLSGPCTLGPGGNSSTPEPASLMMLGTVSLLVTMVIRKRSKHA
jgi:hypothetical protein